MLALRPYQQQTVTFYVAPISNGPQEFPSIILDFPLANIYLHPINAADTVRTDSFTTAQ